MNPDTSLVIGIVVAVFAIPAMVSAISDNRAPRAAAIAVLLGGGFIVFALMNKPGGYSIEDVPQAFTRVVGSFLR